MDERAEEPNVAGTMTAADVLNRLVSLFPDFRRQWEADDNYFIGDDGSFSCCGVFSEFSFFFRDQFGSLPQPALEELGRFVSECMERPQSELGEAAATCFLEKVAYENCSAPLKRYLRGGALQFFSEFDDST